jgi:septum formation protein
MRLVLASASPRRVELLKAAGFVFDVLAVDVDERAAPDEAPASYVLRLAREKAAAAFASLGAAGDLAVLGADTAVVVGRAILGKPGDAHEAAAMLRRLSGRRHDVLTGVALRTARGEHTRVETTSVYFSALNEADIAWYVASGEGLDKAGAYAIQGRASRYITHLEGSYSNVVGLPVAAVYELIRTSALPDP